MIKTLSGNNDFLISDYLHRLIDDFTVKYGLLSVNKIDCEETDVNVIEDNLMAQSLFATKRVVILININQNQDLIEKLDDICQRLAEDNLLQLIIVARAMDKRSKTYKLLKLKTDFLELNNLDESSLTKWLVNKVRQREGSISLKDAIYLIKRVGSDQFLLNNEINKLILYNNHISRESINLLTDQLPINFIFDLLEAAFSGQIKKSIVLYNKQRLFKMEPYIILSMFVWQLRILAIIKTAGGQPNEKIAADLKIKTYTIERSQWLANKLTLDNIKKLLNDLISIDLRSKQSPIDYDDALLAFIIELSEL